MFKKRLLLRFFASQRLLFFGEKPLVISAKEQDFFLLLPVPLGGSRSAKNRQKIIAICVTAFLDFPIPIYSGKLSFFGSAEAVCRQKKGGKVSISSFPPIITLCE